MLPPSDLNLNLMVKSHDERISRLERELRLVASCFPLTSHLLEPLPEESPVAVLDEAVAPAPPPVVDAKPNAPIPLVEFEVTPPPPSAEVLVAPVAEPASEAPVHARPWPPAELAPMPEVETPAAPPAPIDAEAPAVPAAPEQPAEPAEPAPVAAQSIDAPAPAPAVRILTETTIERRKQAAARTRPQVPPPVYSPAGQAPAPAEPDPHPFMTEEEYKGTGKPAAKAPARSMEERIGTTWLLRLGGVLIMLAVGTGATLVNSHMEPWMRVAVGYMIAAAVAAGGVYTKRKNENVGRGGVALALAIGYFVAFASQFVPGMRIEAAPLLLAVVPMLAFATGVVLLAERWRSEGVAAFGFLMALLATLLSAKESGNFALVSLVGLSLASGILLLRNGWITLTGFTLAATYASFGILNAWLRHEGTPINASAGVAAIVLQHVVFLAAFLRWSRPWLARERAMENPGEEVMVPQEFDGGRVPFGRAYDILNSLGLIGLVLVTIYRSDIWSSAGYIMAGMAALEFSRLLFLRVKSPGLAAFHALTGSALAMAATVQLLHGSSASIALAMQTLVLAIAGSQARSLRWLRPLSAIPASAAVVSIVSAGGAAGANSANWLSAIMLLASTLPFGRWMASGVWESQHKALRALSALSAQYRGFASTGLLLGLTFEFANRIPAAGVPATPGLVSMMMPLVALALLIGMLVLDARAWFSGIVLATAVGMFATQARIGFAATPSEAATMILVCGLELTAMAILWVRVSLNRANEESRFAHFQSVIAALGSAVVTIFWTIFHMNAIEKGAPWQVAIAMPVLVLNFVHPAVLAALRFKLPESLGPIRGLLGEVYAALATGLILYATAASSTAATAPRAWLLVAMALVAVGAIRPPAWRLAQALAIVGTAWALLTSVQATAAASPTTQMLIGFACLALADFTARRQKMPAHTGTALCLLVAVPFAISTALVGHQLTDQWLSFWLAFMAALAFGLQYALSRPAGGNGTDGIAGIGSAALLAPAAIVVAVAMDAQVNLIPVIVLSAIALGAAVVVLSKREIVSSHGPALFAVPLLAMSVALPLHSKGFTPGTLLQLGLIGGGAFVIAHLLRRRDAMAVALFQISAMLAIYISITATSLGVGQSAGLVGLSLAAICLAACARFRSQNEFGADSVAVGLACVAALRALLASGLLSGQLITASWGLVALVLLVGGFLLRDRIWRWSAISIFGVALCRVVLVDLGGTDTTAKIFAAGFIGAFMIGAAYLYGILSRRFLDEEPAATPAEHDPE